MSWKTDVSNFFTNPSLSVFGYHSLDYQSYESEIRNLPEINDNLLTFGNLLSIIPLVGAIIGGIYCWAAVNVLRKESASDEERLQAWCLLGRGALQVITLGKAGAILAIVDVIFTVARMCIPAQHSVQ